MRSSHMSSLIMEAKCLEFCPLQHWHALPPLCMFASSSPLRKAVLNLYKELLTVRPLKLHLLRLTILCQAEDQVTRR